MKTFPLTTLGASVICFSALGGGMVNHLTQADLEGALAGGGTVLFGTSGTLTLTNTITIRVDTTLDANGNQVIISGGNAVQLFQVASNVTFGVKGLILADGRVVAGTGDAFGACIWNQGGNVILTGCSLTNNSVQGANGTGGAAFGGALYTVGGSLSLTNCLMMLNQAIGGMGSPPAGNSSPEGGPGGPAMGGAIYSAGATVILQAVEMNGNAVTGGVSVAGPPIGDVGPGGNGFGGALYATGPSIIIIRSSQVLSNSVGGGAAPSGTMGGAGAGDGAGGGLFLSTNSSGDIQLTTFERNSALGGQGYLFYGGGAGKGGNIFTAGDLQVSGSILSGGLASGGSGAHVPGVGRGGAICSTGGLTMNGCALFADTAIGGNADAFSSSSEAGAPAEGGVLWSSGTLACTNTTIATSQALGGSGGGFQGRGPGGAGMGGGLYLTNVTAVLVNLTIAASRADGTNIYHSPDTGLSGPTLGGNLAATNATVSVRNSIIADNGNGGDVWGTVTDGGYNICSDGTADFLAPGSLNQADPLLAALSDSGGPTPTMALLVGSPARDGILSGFPPVDQRGFSRPQGPAADIGAFEADFVGAAPTIVTEPVPQTVRAGTNVIFAIEASGTEPLYYQWRKDGNPVAKATSSALALFNVQVTNVGTYSVLVTNSFGKTTSAGASLVVDSTPIILSQPVSVVVPPQQATNFTVVADGPSLIYQWWHDTAPVPAGTAAMLSIPSAGPGTQGSYFVIISNFANSVTSSVATLSFDSSALSILMPPQNATVGTGYPATFTVLAGGVPPFAYQWERNGVPVLGATNSDYTINAVSTNDAGNYDVVVTNGYRSVTSSPALLTVTPGAVPPRLVPARFGQSITITFNAEAGRTYRLLSSTNLNTWLSLSTNSTISSGQIQFVQPIIAGSNSFYRVVTP